MNPRHQQDDDTEKGTNAWDVYLTMAESADKDLTESWEKGIDVLLVYAALFSSVLASFLSQSFALTQPNPADITNSLLLDLSQSLRNGSTTLPTSTNIPGLIQSRPSSTTLWINALWFASLICALSASFFAMLARQWVQEYKRWMTSHPDDVLAKARLRHFKHLGIQRWRVSTVIWTLPFILHVSLLLFFAGLILFSALADRIIAIISGVLVGIILTCYIITLALPFFFAQCPFQIPTTRPLQNLSIQIYRSILHALVYLSNALSGFSKMKQTLQDRLTILSRLSEGGKEAQLIDDTKDTLDAQVLASLITTSWDKSDKLIASAISSLLLPSSDIRAQDILKSADAASLIEKRYLGLLRFANEFPHLSIAPGSEQDAYTYLRALLHLCEHGAVPRNWKPSNRLRHSLQSCKQTGDTNMRSIVLALIGLIDQLDAPRDDGRV